MKKNEKIFAGIGGAGALVLAYWKYSAYQNLNETGKALEGPGSFIVLGIIGVGLILWAIT